MDPSYYMPIPTLPVTMDPPKPYSTQAPLIEASAGLPFRIPDDTSTLTMEPTTELQQRGEYFGASAQPVESLTQGSGWGKGSTAALPSYDEKNAVTEPTQRHAKCSDASALLIQTQNTLTARELELARKTMELAHTQSRLENITTQLANTQNQLEEKTKCTQTVRGMLINIQTKIEIMEKNYSARLAAAYTQHTDLQNELIGLRAANLRYKNMEDKLATVLINLAEKERQLEQAQLPTPAGVIDSDCVICVTNRRDCAVVPCGHVVMCNRCAQQLRTRHRSPCPVCRGPITGILKLFAA